MKKWSELKDTRDNHFYKLVRTKRGWRRMVYEFEEKESNIEEYIGKIVTVNEVKISEGETISITELILENDEVISTTSEVIKKQAKKLKDEGNLPFKAKIITRKGKAGFSYLTFAKPE